jgi:uncharacterized repeat protein (TIGR03803 family)
VFELAADGTFTTLHTFTGGRDGANPGGTALTIDAQGTLYGTTVAGGLANGGTVWRLRRGKMKVLHSFGLGSDGYWPQAGVLLGSDGSLTGTTTAGGNGCSATQGCGTVFRLAADGSETVLHVFAGAPSDGAAPTGTLVRDQSGNLFGATWQGGSMGQGTVFEIASDGTESLRASFTTRLGQPRQALTLGAKGALYGTTQLYNNANVTALFTLAADGTVSMVHNFGSEGGGAGLPGLIRDRTGTLYGALATGGGNQTGDCDLAGGCGMVFAIAKDGSETLLHAFGGTDGLYPSGGIIADAAGNLYGTTMWGGANNHGTIFKLSRSAK